MNKLYKSAFQETYTAYSARPPIWFKIILKSQELEERDRLRHNNGGHTHTHNIDDHAYSKPIYACMKLNAVA